MNKKIFKLGTFALVMGLTLSMTSCEKDEKNEPMTQTTAQSQTIAEIAVGNEDFSILVDALTRTNLVDVVSDANAELTVFAPTNEAFLDLLEELQYSSLDEAESDLTTEGLKEVLLYHVLGAEVKSSAVTTGYAATATTAKNSLFINTENGVVINDRATVTAVDLDASNGVIHVIDKVILPASLFQLISYNNDFASLKTSLEVADGDLVNLFSTDVFGGPITLFAPNEAAFADLLVELNANSLTDVVGAIGTDGLSNVLAYHALPGNVRAEDVAEGTYTAVNQQDFTISISNGVTITDVGGDVSNVIATDIQGTNGVLHIIDEVLLPNLQ